MLNIANSSVENGLGFNDQANMTYLYGLSDFWVNMFQESEKVNTSLQAFTIHYSETYSKFLQLTSQISLQDIQETIDSQIKLLVISTSSQVSGEVETYTLPENVLSCRFLSNRPVLPTLTLENEVHYRIDQVAGTIAFYKPVGTIGFPSKKMADGTTQYAIWMTDARVDENLLYDVYGKLIGMSPDAAIGNYKDFLIGLYYMYTGGPDLATIRKGLDLVLGIPLARDTETVLDIRTYHNTNQFLVITNLNSYLIPYGLSPSIGIGDTLNVLDKLTTWIDVEDYLDNGDWWLNLKIPAKLIPFAAEDGRYASPGSSADYLMRNYLKTHTFLINIKTTIFKNGGVFDRIASIVEDIKPTYTTPIYIWSVIVGGREETVSLTEEFGGIDLIAGLHETPMSSANFVRDAEVGYRFFRGDVNFTMFNAPKKVGRLIGSDAAYNGPTRVIGTSTGVGGGGSSDVIETRYRTGAVSIGTYDNIVLDKIPTSTGTITGLKISAPLTSAAYTISTTRRDGGGAGGPPTLMPAVGFEVSIDGETTYSFNSVSGSPIPIYASEEPLNNIRAGTLDGTTCLFLDTTNILDASYGLSLSSFSGTGTSSLYIGVFPYPAVEYLWDFFASAQIDFPNLGITYTVTFMVDGSDSVNEIVTGYIEPQKQFRNLTLADKEMGWVSAMLYMGNPNWTPYMSKPIFVNRDGSDQLYQAGADPFNAIFPGYRAKYMYTTTIADVQAKMILASSGTVPAMGEGLSWFSLLPSGTSGSATLLTANFSSYFERDSSVTTLGYPFPQYSYRSFPPVSGSILDGDNVLFTYVTNTVLGVFWLTSNFTVEGDPYCEIIDTESAKITVIGAMTAGLGPSGDYRYLIHEDSPSAPLDHSLTSTTSTFDI